LLALPPPGMSVEAVQRVTRDGKANLAGTDTATRVYHGSSNRRVFSHFR
jgi:hypothetical protein